jgi:hypothetical protein
MNSPKTVTTAAVAISAKSVGKPAVKAHRMQIGVIHNGSPKSPKPMTIAVIAKPTNHQIAIDCP